MRLQVPAADNFARPQTLWFQPRRFLGLFAGLCTIFAACATLIDWHDEASQERLVIAVAAVVDRADLVASARPPKAGGGTEWKLYYHVHYEAGGETLTAKLTSRPAFSQTEAASRRQLGGAAPQG